MRVALLAAASALCFVRAAPGGAPAAEDAAAPTTILAAAAAAPEAAAGSRSAPTTIMAVGDSITFGCGYQAKPPGYGLECSGGDSSYRAKLYELLTAGGHAVQMVGRAKSGDPKDVGFPAHQHAHEGYSGNKINDLDAKLFGSNPYNFSAAPDIMLVMLGTNDIWHLNSTTQTMQARMESFLNHTYAKMPKTKVFLASITNMAGRVNLSDHDPLGSNCPGHLGHKGGESCCWGCRQYWPPMVVGLNAMLKEQAASHKAAGKNIEFVDLFTESKICSTAASPEANDCCHSYHVHPTKVGYEKMAAVWAKHVSPHLKTTDADALLAGRDTAPASRRGE